jgi:phenylacetyl-CoA:acceptor oxidoreductase 26-kDa subunit
MNAYGPTPWLQRHWDGRAAANFIGGGLGSGLLVAAAAAHWLDWPWRLALLVGVVAIGIGLFCVWLEIGRPWRAMNVFINPRTSAMSRESMAAVTAFAIAGVAFVTDLRWASAVTAVAALYFVWCQARMLRAARGIPAWRHPAIVPLVVGSAVADGVAVYAVLQLPARVFAPVGQIGLLVASLLALVVVRWWLWHRYRLQLGGSASPQLRAVLDRLAQVQRRAHLAAGALLVLALAVPLAAPVLVAVAGSVAATAGAWLRFALIRRAAFNQGFALPRLPVRGTARQGPSAPPPQTSVQRPVRTASRPAPAPATAAGGRG